MVQAGVQAVNFSRRVSLFFAGLDRGVIGSGPRGRRFKILSARFPQTLQAERRYASSPKSVSAAGMTVSAGNDRLPRLPQCAEPIRSYAVANRRAAAGP